MDVNVINLLPTLLAITFVPFHFYKRLPGYISSKYTWFKTPLKFFSGSLAMIFMLLTYMSPDALNAAGVSDKTAAIKYLALICLTTPITIPLICVIIGLGGNITYMFPPLRMPNVISSSLLIPLSPWTYARLDYRQFLWSIFYFGIYFFIACQVVQIIGIGELVLASKALKHGELVSEGKALKRADTCAFEIAKLDPNHVLPQKK